MTSSVSYIKRDGSISENSSKSSNSSLSFSVSDSAPKKGPLNILGGTTRPIGDAFVNTSDGSYYTQSGVSSSGAKYYTHWNSSGTVLQKKVSASTIKTLLKNGTISSNNHKEYLTSVDYSTDKKIGSQSLDTVINNLNKSVLLPGDGDSVQSYFNRTTNYYNRFKIANPNASLQKGFAHVFFVRPSCNILTSDHKSMLNSLKNHELFSYAWQSTPALLKELSSGVRKDDFMLSLSNAAASFSLSDEYIGNDSYGKTYTGYKISYGQNNIESKTAGTFSVTYNDDRNFHIYQLHRLWVEYINGVYRGEFAPKTENILNKILDYTSAVYYIVTAEDGESIIFWSKYYGVFPTTIPSTQYSWAAGNLISNPQIDITYSYSFKEDFNPYTILEFNYNACAESGSSTYIPVYDPKLGHVGKTWVGVPFIELIKGDGGIYFYKLRFKKP